MRLPSYRSSYMHRYHPYPRVGLSKREILTQIRAEDDTLHTLDDRLSNYNIEYDDTSEPNGLDAPDNEDEQENDVNLPVEVREPGGEPRVRRLNLTTFFIVLLLLVARKLTLNAQ